jgi:pimeloyl-ACP methyl ester carboxylesterase
MLAALAQLFAFAQGKSPESMAAPTPGFAERQLSFPSDGSRVRGTLCVPAGRTGKVPAVILAYGTGPRDVVQADFGAGMFGDLAHALARAGILSLRYDPRQFSFSDAPVPGELPLDVQIGNEGVAALRYLGGLEEVDPSALFVLGHGLGGTMAPYIAARYGRARGLILMAAPALPIEKTLARRKRLALQAKAVPEQEVAELITAQNQIFSDIRSGKLPPSRFVEGATVAYWRDRMNRDPARKARSLNLALLVLQGGKDAEVDEADYDRLQLLLTKRPGAAAQFHWFAKLDHFFRSDGTSQPGGTWPSRLDPEVVEIIARWIKSQVPGANRQ